MPGPAPKRDAQRRRTNAPAIPTTTVEVPPLGEALDLPHAAPKTPEGLHPIARRWYESLAVSGQAMFYEPSDWAQAEVAAWALTKVINMRRFSAMSLDTALKAMAGLLPTEAERRRVRLEVERKKKIEDRPAGVVAIEGYKKRLGA